MGKGLRKTAGEAKLSRRNQREKPWSPFGSWSCSQKLEVDQFPKRQAEKKGNPGLTVLALAF